jgi:CheY-like chemotaxis protein
MTLINHLLLVDDSDATNNFHRRLLDKLKFAQLISTCKNGREALDFFDQSDLPCVDLIFLDLNMPVLDGFEFLEKLPEAIDRESCQKLPPVVVLTSSEENVDQERCKNLYKDITFYSKPLSIGQVNEIGEKYSDLI